MGALDGCPRALMEKSTAKTIVDDVKMHHAAGVASNRIKPHLNLELLQNATLVTLCI